MNKHLTVAPETWALDNVFTLLKVLTDPKQAKALLEDIQEVAKQAKADIDSVSSDRAENAERQKELDGWEQALKAKEASLKSSWNVLEANIARHNEAQARFQAEFDRITNLEKELKETYSKELDELLAKKLEANETFTYLTDLKQDLEAKEKLINEKLAKLKELL